MNDRPNVGSKPTTREMLLQHVIVFLICIAFPGLVTSYFPSTWLAFERSNGTTRCVARTCVFFVVPYKVQQVDHVAEIKSRERAGGVTRQREYGRDTGKYVHIDGAGFLQIHGNDGNAIEVSVSPASLDEVLRRSRAFLDANEDGSTTLFTIANWKFGAVMGGVLTSFTVLYVVGYSLELLKYAWKGLGLPYSRGRR